MSARWWAISEEAFMEALNRAHEGADPELLYLELYANSDTENVDGNDSNGEAA